MPLNAWDGAFIGVMTVSGSSEDVPQRVRLAWVELNCLTCGGVAGFIENQRIVRPVSSGGIRLERGRPRCGRCGGVVLGGARGLATSRAAIGPGSSRPAEAPCGN